MHKEHPISPHSGSESSSFDLLLLPPAMKTLMAKSSVDSSFSFSKRYFNCKKRVDDEEDDDERILTYQFSDYEKEEEIGIRRDSDGVQSFPALGKKHSAVSVLKLRSALTVFSKSRSSSHQCSLGRRVIVTLFGHRKGHVHFAFQDDQKLNPPFLIELSIPTSLLIKEMASGQVRIALESERKPEKPKGRTATKLLEEQQWRTYCNGKKSGYAVKMECGSEEWKVLKAVEPISMGAGVLPWRKEDGEEGETMFMRAKFERVVGSKDSEAFYMVNPDKCGGPELSIYLLRA